MPMVFTMHKRNLRMKERISFAQFSSSVSRSGSETIKELVEELYGCEFELFVEFTGLISWTRGAKIGWHSDNGRAYLKQRHFTAVCYLNSHTSDFHGGLFHFREGLPSTIVPEIGDVVIYRAEDVHCVDEVMQGERCTLALWFTKDSSFDEDATILNSMGISSLKSSVQFHAAIRDELNEAMWMPLPPSSSMYSMNFLDEGDVNASEDSKGLQCDLRVARLAALGFDFGIAVGESLVGLQETGSLYDEKFELVQDALEKPIMLKLNKQVVHHVFANSLHALQVLYFCEWKESERQQDAATKEGIMSEENGDSAAGSISGAASRHDRLFIHLREWEQHMATNYAELQRCFPVWNRFKRISATVS